MGKVDLSMKELFKDKNVFADLFNVEFNGEYYVDPDKLRPWNSEETINLLDNMGKLVAASRIRDSINIMEDNDTVYCLFAIEFEDRYDRTMPVKVALKDILSIMAAVNAVVAENREKDRRTRALEKAKREKQKKQGEESGDPSQLASSQADPDEKTDLFRLSSEDYIAGFTAQDRISPVVTLVAYTGITSLPETEYDIHSIVNFEGRNILRRFMMNYKLNIISFCNMPLEKAVKYRTALRAIIESLRICCDKSMKDIRKTVRRNPFFREKRAPFVNGVISNLLGVNVGLQSGEEDVSLGEEVGTMYEDGCEDMMAAIQALAEAMTAAGRADEFLTAAKDGQLPRLFAEFGIEVDA